MRRKKMVWIFSCVILMAQLQIGRGSVYNIPENDTTDYCQWKHGHQPKPFFNLETCTWCFFFLFPHGSFHFMNFSQYSEIQLRASFIPDVHNDTIRALACHNIPEDDCNMWQMCCNAAEKCCDKQIQSRDDDVINTSCGTTWDGFACWEGGPSGTNNYMSCPTFLKFSIPTRMAVKTCLSDGTWMRKDGAEWTDYTPCLTYQELRVTLYIGLACQIASLIFLLPSLAIFLGYKFLRKQHRIRLHINFFISFIMSNGIHIMWSVFVTYDKLTNPHITETLMHRNLWGCKMLSFLKMYFTSTNYVWMFCEGFYLYRLISNAFSPPKRLLLLYIAGWGVPFSYCLVYALVRVAMKANESCWSISLGDLEWIIYVPNLACLLVNIFFLCCILRILLTQLQAHPNEPSNFRRALKATFVLIPLFGVQLAVTIYRPPPESSVAVYYERFSEVITHSQGLVVALIFCFFNGEVATQIKRSWGRVFMDRNSGSKRFTTTFSLHFNNSITQRTQETTQARRDSLEPCLNDKLPSTTQSSLSTAQTELL